MAGTVFTSRAGSNVTAMFGLSFGGRACGRIWYGVVVTLPNDA